MRAQIPSIVAAFAASVAALPAASDVVAEHTTLSTATVGAWEGDKFWDGYIGINWASWTDPGPYGYSLYWASWGSPAVYSFGKALLDKLDPGLTGPPHHGPPSK